MTISNNLKKAREKCELSYAELANLTGIAKSTLQRYETGTTSKIPLDAVEKISKALKTDPQALLGWQDEDIEDTEIKKVFTNRLNYFLDKNGATQIELANYMDLSNTTINNWVKGYKMPRMDKIDKICTFLGIKRADLISEDKPHIPPPEQDEKDIAKIIEKMRERLTRNDLVFEGRPVTSGDIQSILAALQVGMEMARKQINDKK